MKLAYEASQIIAGGLMLASLGHGALVHGAPKGKTVPQPTPSELTTTVEKLGLSTVGTALMATYTKSLPDGEHATIVVDSASSLNGRPYPGTVQSFSLSVEHNSSGTSSDVAPIVSISFTRTANNLWDAYQTVGDTTKPNESLCIYDFRERQIKTFTATVINKTIQYGQQSSQTDAQLASDMLGGFETNAALDLSLIEQGKALS